jgi:hypothetical protein
MYRIEVAPGEETVFRTIEELAVGIRNGVITQRSRIYHHASQKWLPIGLHPHYKKALEMPAASASPAPVTTATPVPSPSRKGHGSSHAHPHVVSRPPEPKPAPEPKIYFEPKLNFEPKVAPEPKAIPEPKASFEPKVTHEPKSTHEPKPTHEPKVTHEPKAFHERKAFYEPKPAPKIRAPVQSPVIAMQQEVLRDLPVVSIPEPEPLPWQAPAPQAAAVPIYRPRPVHAPAVHAAPIHRSIAHAPLGQGPIEVPAASYVPLEYSGPLAEPHDVEGDELQPRPTARRSRRFRGHPVRLLGAAAVLVVGTHLVLTGSPFPSAGSTEAPVPAAPADDSEASSDPVSQDAGQPAAEPDAPETRPSDPRVTIAPARVPMTPGPAFAGSAPVRPGADSASVSRPSTPAPVPAPAVAAAIAPAPAALELGLPDLPPDSLAPSARARDTMGMKKILRALNGPKPAKVPTAQ